MYTYECRYSHANTRIQALTRTHPHTYIHVYSRSKHTDSDMSAYNPTPSTIALYTYTHMCDTQMPAHTLYMQPVAVGAIVMDVTQTANPISLCLVKSQLCSQQPD